jgi:hypothetical protein
VCRRIRVVSMKQFPLVVESCGGVALDDGLSGPKYVGSEIMKNICLCDRQSLHFYL